MSMDLTRLLLQCRLTGGKVIRISATASRDTAVDVAPVISGGAHPIESEPMFGSAPLHRILVEGEEGGVRWAHFEPIPR